MQARSLASGACTRIGLWRLRCSFDWVFQLEGGIRRLPSSFGCSSTGQYQDWLPIVPWPSACFNLGQSVRRPRLRGGAPPARAAQVYLAGASVAADIFALRLHRRRSPLALRKLSERCLPMPTLAVLALSLSLCCSPLPWACRYVVDCGRVKRRTWDLRAGTSRFEVGWISQASADQRAGRAGRTGPGHTYRLYSAAVFQERFSRFEPPETETMPLDAMVLQLKKMGIRSVQSFPFPSPPPKHALIAAVRQLSALGILQLSKGHAASMGPGAAEASSGPAARDEEALTALGDRVADLPVAPSLAKMLVLAASGGPDLLAWVTAVVAIMTADTPFIYPKRRRPQDIKAAARARAAGGAEAEAVRQLDGDEDGDADDDGDADADPLELAAMTATSAAEEAELAERRKEAEECRIAHGRIRHTSSDALTALRLVGAHAHSCIDASTGALDGAGSVDWCKRHFVRHKTLKEAFQLRKQLHSRVAAMLSGTGVGIRGGDADAAEREGDGGADVSPADSGSSSARFPARLPKVRRADEERILQVVTAGLLHRVARRATAEEAEAILPQHGLSLHTGGGRAGSRVPYLPCDERSPSPLFVHPRSALCRDDIGDMPEMIVAQEVLQSSGVTKRHLLRGCSEVDEEWLADLSAGTPMVVLGRALPVPQPDYDPDLTASRPGTSPSSETASGGSAQCRGRWQTPTWPPAASPGRCSLAGCLVSPSSWRRSWWRLPTSWSRAAGSGESRRCSRCWQPRRVVRLPCRPALRWPRCGRETLPSCCRSCRCGTQPSRLPRWSRHGRPL